MLPEIIFRDARPVDSPALTDLSAQLGYPVSEEHVRNRLAGNSANEKEKVIVAESSGAVIGWITAAVVDLFHAEPFVEIHGFVVDQKHRRKGIGKLFVEEIQKWAAEKGMKVIRVRANAVRKEAHEFYRNNGFVKIKEQWIFEKELP